MEYTIQRLVGLIHDHETIRSNYHFLNSELFELNRIEREIQALIEGYDENLSDLIELVNRIPKLTRFIEKEKLEEMKKEIVRREAQTNNQFYSYDGQVFSNIEDAMTRNNEIMMGLQQNTTSGKSI